MRTTSQLRAVAMLLFITVCPCSSGYADDFMPVTQLPSPRFALPGFTITLPTEDRNWFIARRLDGQRRDDSVNGGFKLIAVRRGPQELISSLISHDDSTFGLTAVGVVAPIPGGTAGEITASLMQAMQKRADDEAERSSRLRRISSQFSPDRIGGAACIRWDATSEDRGVPGHEGEPFELSIHRLACSHPDYPSYVIILDYSQRVAPDHGSGVKDIEDGALAALKSLTFTRWGYRVTRIAVGNMPQVITNGFGSIWVTYGDDRGTVARVDPAQNRIVATVQVGHHPIGIAADDHDIWVANSGDGTLSRVDPATNAVTATLTVGGHPQLIAMGAGSLWLAKNDTGSVARLNPKTGTSTEIPGIGGEPAGIVTEGSSVFVTNYTGSAIAKIDAGNNAISARIEGGQHSNFIISDGQNLWVNDQISPAVLRIPIGGGDVARFQHVGDRPTGISLWNGRLWVANWGGASLSVLDPNRPEAAGEVLPTGKAPIDILAARGALWVTVVGDGSLLRVDPAP